MPTVLKDGITGAVIGCAVIVPGISGGTIALILGAFKKIVNAVDNLFTKQFWKNVLVLLPFLIGSVLAVAGLIVPFKLAFDYCMLAIVCLFVGLIAGSLPSVTDNIKGEKLTKINVLVGILGFVIAALIGVLSVIFNLNTQISNLFNNWNFALYLIIFAVGIISASGLIVPGFSGSMLLLVIGFYYPILSLGSDLIHGENPTKSFTLLFVFGLGIALGLLLFSKLMNYTFNKHKTSSFCVVIGFILGSIISIFVNSQMFEYLSNYQNRLGNGLIDWILSPILLILGIFVSYAFVKYSRKHKEQ